MQITSTKHLCVRMIECVFRHDLFFSQFKCLSIFFSTFLSSTEHTKRSARKKWLIVLTDLIISLQKRNRKWFIRQSRCRMFVIRPSAQVMMMDSFRLTFMFIVIMALSMQCLLLAINTDSKDSENNANHNEQCLTSIRGVFSFMVIF